MYERIIVPLDGSRLSEAALPYAEELAAKMSSHLTLLTVLESDAVNEYQKNQWYARRIAEVTKSHAQKYGDNGGSRTIEVETVARRGNAAEGIIGYSNNGGGDLIIMASHGRSGLTRWAVGSVADKVVRAPSARPVMLIRAKEKRSDIRDKRILKRTLIPLDGSMSSRLVLHYVREIASRLGMELILLQVVPDKKQSQKDAEAYLKIECNKLREGGINANHRVGVGNPAEIIIDLAGELACDLVAMSTRGKTGVNLGSLGSVAQKVFLCGDTPLLLVKQHVFN